MSVSLAGILELEHGTLVDSALVSRCWMTLVQTLIRESFCCSTSAIRAPVFLTLDKLWLQMVRIRMLTGPMVQISRHRCAPFVCVDMCEAKNELRACKA